MRHQNRLSIKNVVLFATCNWQGVADGRRGDRVLIRARWLFCKWCMLVLLSPDIWLSLEGICTLAYKPCPAVHVQKPNLHEVEVSEHNLKSSKTCLYGFLQPLGGEYGFLSGFPPFSFTMYNYNNRTKRMREFKEIGISRQSCIGDCE